jgi:predicted nucleic acid-binding protein
MRVVIDTNVVVSAYAGSTSSACSLRSANLLRPTRLKPHDCAIYWRDEYE